MSELGNPAWANVSVIHPIGIAATGLLISVIALARSRWVLVALLVAACFIPAGQRIVIFGLDFTVFRILVMAGLARGAMSGWFRGLDIRLLDLLVIAGGLTSLVAYTLLWGTSQAFINRCGYLLDVLGGYFLFRVLLRDWASIILVYRTLAVCAVICAGAFLIEYSTGRNGFAILGGVPEITSIREGRLRCQGPFSHSILAGSFWASLFPVFISLVLAGQNRWLAAAGAAASVACIALSGSSTPIAALALGVAALCWWPWRNWTPALRMVALACAIALQLLMERGVAHLLSRVDIVGGSTGWHRFFLIDTAIDRFDEWWLIGIKSTVHWHPLLWDVTNQYLLDGFRGGVLALLLLVAQIVVGFNLISVACNRWRGTSRERIIYGFGVALFIHAVVFLTVSYFGQLLYFWLLHLAVLQAASPRHRLSPRAVVSDLARQVAREKSPAGSSIRSRDCGPGIGRDETR